MQQNLSITLDSLIELLIGLRRIFQRHLVRNDKGWFGPSGDDQIAQITIILLDITLSSAERQAFFEEFAEGE